MPTRLLLVDDHQIVRKGLRAILEQQPNLQVVGEANTGLEAVEMAIRLKPEVMLMDISLPGLNGIDATRKIIAELPGVRIIALTAHSVQDMIGGAFNAGAVGYLLKDSAVEELGQAIRTVMEGGVYVTPRVAGAMVDRYVAGTSRPRDTSGAFARLTNREREVLQLMAEGRATKEVARALGVSVKTAETHRRAIMEKLDLHSVAELTKYAIRAGITSL